MGMQFLIEARTMKFLGVLALAAIACAEPEAEAKADPAYWYSNYWGAQPAYYGGYRSYASPYWGGYYNRGYGYWKRDADSKPEAKADPAFFYRNYYHSPYYNSHSWGMDNNMGMNQMQNQWNMDNMQMNNRNMMQYNMPWGYNMYHQGSRFFKREAEADAEPAYWYGNFYNGNQWGYSGWYNRPYGYADGFWPFGGFWW